MVDFPQIVRISYLDVGTNALNRHVGICAALRQVTVMLT